MTTKAERPRLRYGPTSFYLQSERLSHVLILVISLRAGVDDPATGNKVVFAYPGTRPGVSAKAATTGIVWVIEHGGSDVLHAYDARNLGNELYYSN
jgi:hypothetical protein